MRKICLWSPFSIARKVLSDILVHHGTPEKVKNLLKYFMETHYHQGYCR